ncbi:MAG: hypothetical protein MUC42_00735 [Bryobacter sp.]|nr:hypothetical protein [Bryobacter sp.]
MIALLVLGGVLAHDPITTKLTWSKEIARIVYRRCAGCHREGGGAPFALVRYEEARPWARAIQEEVNQRRMPPWAPVKGYGEFADEGSLTQEEIGLINDWVDGGAPEGDAKLLPKLPAAGAAALEKGRTLRVTKTMVLSKPVRIETVHPEGPLRAWAELPDGGRVPLVWVRQPVAKPARRGYRLAEPLPAPKGTRIHLEGAPLGLGIR